jgi:hypothetical protein
MSVEAGHHTRREIFQQPALWPTTLERVDAASHQFDLKNRLAGKRILFPPPIFCWMRSACWPMPMS